MSQMVILAQLEHDLQRQRARIVRLCRQWTGNADAAEDLAQETLIEAWRHIDQLHNPAAIDAWLAGIARNVCRRWFRRQSRDRAREFAHSDDAALHEYVADVDLEMELERDELATMLDQALALLPDATRAALIAHYIERTPQAEIAQRLGVSEGAVAVRLHRGKLAFKQVLATNFRAAAQSYGLLDNTGEWTSTRMWCPVCGQQRLEGSFDHERGAFALRCPGCSGPQNVPFSRVTLPGVLAGVKGYKAGLSRVLSWADTYFRTAISQRSAVCELCGTRNTLQIGTLPHAEHGLQNIEGMFITCTNCGSITFTGVSSLAFMDDRVQQFWRQNPRIRLEREYALSYHGRPAILVQLDSVGSSATIDTISAQDTYEVLDVHIYHRS